MRLIYAVIFMVMLSSCLYAAELNCNPPEISLWNISGQEVVCENRSLNVTGIILSDNASLTLNDTLILTNSTFYINVTGNSSFVLTGASSNFTRQSGPCSYEDFTKISLHDSSEMLVQSDELSYTGCRGNIVLRDQARMTVDGARLELFYMTIQNQSFFNATDSNLTDTLAIYTPGKASVTSSELQGLVVQAANTGLELNRIGEDAYYNCSDSDSRELEISGSSMDSIEIYLTDSNLTLEHSEVEAIYFEGRTNSTLYNSSILDLTINAPNQSSLEINDMNHTDSVLDSPSTDFYINSSRNSIFSHNLYILSGSNLTIHDSYFRDVHSYSRKGEGNIVNITHSVMDEVYSSAHDTMHIKDTPIHNDCKFLGFVTAGNMSCEGGLHLKGNTTIVSNGLEVNGTLNIEPTGQSVHINISGNLTLPDTVDWTGVCNLARGYPLKVFDNQGVPVSGTTVEVTGSDGRLVWNGTTGLSGNALAWIEFNSSNYNQDFTISFFNQTRDIGILTDTPISLTETQGRLRLISTSPVSAYTAYYQSSFIFNLSTVCIGGYCGNVTLTLDPEEKGRKDEQKPLDYDKYREERFIEDIKGVIVELKDKPLVKEYNRLKQEIEALKSSKGGLFTTAINDYRVKKLERELPKKLKERKLEIRERQERVMQQLESAGVTGIERQFDTLISGFSIDLDSDEIERMMDLDIYNRYIKDIHLNVKHTILLNDSVPTIGAPSAWVGLDSYGYNLTGVNTTIAIIDTGIDYTHPDLGNCSTTTKLNGTPESYVLETPHPYENDFDYTYNITMAGYSRIAAHFRNMSFEYGYDGIYILDGNGTIVSALTGERDDFWTPTVPGDTIGIRVITDYSITDYGFTIDQIVEGEAVTNWSLCDKVVGGYDLVNEDPDPMDDQGHGTHCAAIAAGNGVLKGVAPDARLYGYKVLDASGSGYSDDIIAGIERAMDPNGDGDFSDHVDVISMSLGGSGTPFDSMSRACENAMDAGVTVVIAAGNDGPYEKSVSCPGCAPKVITVGATNKKSYPILGTNSSVQVINGTALKSIAFENSVNTTRSGVVGRLINGGKGNASDFSSLNFTDRVALVERGSVTYDDIADNAQDAGCRGVIVYNDYPSIFTGYLTNTSDIPIVSVSQLDGEYLLNLTTVETYVNITVLTVYEIVAEFSSRGPSYMYNKPDVLAPGVGICAAKLPGTSSYSDCIDSDHTMMSGTSMATPHVAGAAAILIQKNPAWTPYQVKSALEYTALDINQDMNIQGAGIINISKAVQLEHPPPVAMIFDIPEVVYR